MNDSVCIETKRVRFSYPDGPEVLSGISFTIHQGGFVAIIGQNGSGKTTLAKHLNGLLRPTSGEVLLLGKTIGDQPVSDMAKDVGYVFQNPDHQIFSSTVREELAFGPRNLGLDEVTVNHRTEKALECFELSPLADHPPASLGFGLRRKVSVAAVYAMRTPIIILDEPTTGLDLKSTTDLMQLICGLNRQGSTIILITHDMRVVAEYAPHCIVMRSGEIRSYGKTRDIFGQTKLLRETQVTLPQIPELGRRLKRYGMRSDILTVSEFCDECSDILVKAA